jgi:molybdate transport system ATP-binding protein
LQSVRPTSPAEPIVQLDGVDVDVDGRRVLHGIDLTIGPGQHWGVVGGNGSGKSTLLALLAGMRWPAPGRGSRVYDFGAGPERDAVTARQRIALHGHELQDLYFARGWNFRVRDVVLSGLTRSDIPKRRTDSTLIARAGALLERLGLGHLRERRLLELSRGEQRRVLIARELATDPALLLLDEPASGLDAQACAGLDKLLAAAAATTQIVVAAHRREELPGIVTDMAVLEDGRLHVAESAAALRPDELLVQRSTNAADSAPATTAAAADAGAALIAVEDASVWLDGRRVLCAIDWTLRSGEHWLITGPNGAGKSTLLRLLHGELRPARGGRIRWPGLDDPRSVWALRRSVSLVSPELQARYLYPTTVFDAVASGFHSSIGKVRALSNEQRERVGRVIAAFGLEPFADRLLTRLSYGQRHRVLIARTLVTEPRVLLLDEPWAGLDSRTADIVSREIVLRMSSGTQVVCVSHIGAGGLPLNRSLRLEAGRILSADDTAAPRGNSSSARSRGADFRPR